VRAALLVVASLVLVGCGSTTVGLACRKHDDCKGLKDGYCSRAEICTRECSAANPCDPGTSCVTVGRRVCLPTCTADSSCLKGFSCQAVEDQNVCLLTNPFEPVSN
jgi:hypothetical protein